MKSDSTAAKIRMLIMPCFVYLLISFAVQFAAMFFVGMKCGINFAGSNADQLYEALINEYMSIAMYVTMIAALLTLPYLLISYKKDSDRLDMKSEEVSPLLYSIVAVLGICICYFLNALLSVTGLSALLEEGYEETAEMIYSAPIVLQFAVTAVLVPVVEELIFRGLIFRRLRTYCIFPLAALISAILFGLYHMNLLQFIYAGILGLFLAYAYERFRSILAPIILHASANAFSVLITENQNLAMLLGGDQKRLLVTMSAAAVFGAISMYVLIKTNEKEEEEDEASDNRSSLL